MHYGTTNRRIKTNRFPNQYARHNESARRDWVNSQPGATTPSRPDHLTPKDGRALYRFLMEREREGAVKLLGNVLEFGRQEGYGERIVEWTPEQVAVALAAADEFLKAERAEIENRYAKPAPVKPEAPATPVKPEAPARQFGEGIELEATTPAPAPTVTTSSAPIIPVVHAATVFNPKAPEPKSLYSFLAAEVNRLRFEVGHLAALAAADAMVVLMSEVAIMGGRMNDIDASEFFSRRDAYHDMARRESA